MEQLDRDVLANEPVAVEGETVMGGRSPELMGGEFGVEEWTETDLSEVFRHELKDLLDQVERRDEIDRDRLRELLEVLKVERPKEEVIGERDSLLNAWDYLAEECREAGSEFELSSNDILLFEGASEREKQVFLRNAGVELMSDTGKTFMTACDYVATLNMVKELKGYTEDQTQLKAVREKLLGSEMFDSLPEDLRTDLDKAVLGRRGLLQFMRESKILRAAISGILALAFGSGVGLAVNARAQQMQKNVDGGNVGGNGTITDHANNANNLNHPMIGGEGDSGEPAMTFMQGDDRIGNPPPVSPPEFGVGCEFDLKLVADNMPDDTDAFAVFEPDHLGLYFFGQDTGTDTNDWTEYDPDRPQTATAFAHVGGAHTELNVLRLTVPEIAGAGSYDIMWYGGGMAGDGEFKLATYEQIFDFETGGCPTPIPPSPSPDPTEKPVTPSPTPPDDTPVPTEPPPSVTPTPPDDTPVPTEPPPTPTEPPPSPTVEPTMPPSPTEEPNLPPVLSGLVYDEYVPRGSDPVPITIQVDDPNGDLVDMAITTNNNDVVPWAYTGVDTSGEGSVQITFMYDPEIFGADYFRISATDGVNPAVYMDCDPEHFEGCWIGVI